MKTIGALLLSLSLALTAAAQQQESARLRFVPAAPDSRTPVDARLEVVVASLAPPCIESSVSGFEITIAVACRRVTGITMVTIPFGLSTHLGVLPAGRYEVIILDETQVPGRELGRSELIVHDAAPSFRLVPNVGMGTDFDRVRIISNGLFVCDDTAACAAPEVRFGDKVATIVEMSLPNEIVVKPPTGIELTVVDVTVTFGLATTRVANAYYYGHEFAPPHPAFYEPLLIPVHSKGPGAHGSNWDSEMSVRNDNDHPLTAVPNPFYNGCFPICDTRLAGRTSWTFRPPNEGLAEGFVIHLPRQDAPNVALNLMVRDLSRQAEALGAEIPVVRESEFHEGPFGVVNVPVDPRFRVAFRLYSIDGAGSMQLVFKPMSGALPVLVTPPLPVPERLLISDLLAWYPELAGHGPLRIEVVPMTPAHGRFWGFAALTNNETQHVTVVSPQ
jgi:hypothetical protein